MQLVSLLCLFRSSNIPTTNCCRRFCKGNVLPLTRKKVGRDEINFQSQRFLSEDWDHKVDEILQDQQYEEFSHRMFRLPQHGHDVLVVQPFVRDFDLSKRVAEGSKERPITTPQLQLEEAIALVQTLPRWKVAGSCILGVPSFNRTTLFGSGQIDSLKETIHKSKNISAIFVSVNILRVKQIISLEQAFNLPVFDRYTIVIQIFRQHAITNESKLQVSMAEIPYLRQCIKGFPKGLSDRLDSGGVIGGAGSLFVETRKELLNAREQKLKKALNLLRKHRERLRSNSHQQSYPIIAVVGYTNAGKTSLIKALTGTDKLTPRNQLFATLDVTKHEGTLPCKLKVLYVDTVGFITDIPTGLLESFTATLEDAIYSDAIIHVWDVSNPDFRKQRAHVMATLDNLNFGEELSKKIFVIANKADKISPNELSELQKTEPDMYFVSTKTGYGMEKMLHDLQEFVIRVSGKIRMKIRVRTGGEEHEWLRKKFAVECMVLENDSEFTLLTVVTSKPQLETFKHKFLNTNK